MGGTGGIKGGGKGLQQHAQGGGRQKEGAKAQAMGPAGTWQRGWCKRHMPPLHAGMHFSHRSTANPTKALHPLNR